MKAETRPILYFIWLSLVTQTIGSLLWLHGKNNLFLLHFYIPFGFLCLAWFYRTLWKQYISPGILPVVSMCFVGYSIINSVFIQDLFSFNSNAVTVQSILIVVFAISTYYLILDSTFKSLHKEVILSLNWFNSGLFIYYACNLIFFYFGELIMSNIFPSEAGRLAWLPHAFFTTVMYVCFFIGLWKNPRHLK